MKLKPLAWTVVVLAALCALAFWLQRPAPRAADPRVNQPVLDPALVSRAARLDLTAGNQSVELAKPPGGAWIVASYYGLPADFSKLGQLINDLTQAKIQRFVTANPARLARLDFPGTVLTLSDQAGHDLIRIEFGKSSDNGGRFLRYNTDPKAYLATLATDFDLVAKNWAGDALLSLKPDDIKTAAIGFAGDPPVIVTRAKPGAPFTAEKTPAHETLNADTLASLLRTLGDLRFQDTAALHASDADAARAHERTFVLTTFAGETVTLKIGRKPAETIPLPPAQKPAATANAKTPPTPATRTIPAGPVYAFVASSNPRAAINALMQKRAFQLYDYFYGELPAHPADLFSAEPPAAPKR